MVTFPHNPVCGPTILFTLLEPTAKVETPIHDSIRELVTWECKEHGVKS